MPPHHPHLQGKPPQLVLLRHGETAWSLNGRHTGVTDLPLTEAGERRAALWQPVLGAREFGLVLTSPRRRARRTALLAGFPDAVVDDDLVEFDYGAYEGLTSPQIQALRPGWDLWRDGAPPSDEPGGTRGEHAGDVRARVDRVIRRALPVLDEGRDVLAVAHGHVLRALGAAWIDLPPEGGAHLVLSTAGLAELGFEHGNRVIDAWNEVREG